MNNEPAMADMLDEVHVHGLGNLPLDDPGDLHIGVLGGVQVNQIGKRCFPFEYECLKNKVTGL